MITEGKGSIFDSGCEALVNPVNCVGISGKGLAKEFSKRFRASHRRYASECRMKNLIPGRIYVDDNKEAFYIIYFPTKKHWLDNSDLTLIVAGLGALCESVNRHKIKSIAVPALGCGLGNLDWDDVRPLIENAAKVCPETEWVIYAPQEKVIGTMIFSK